MFLGIIAQTTHRGQPVLEWDAGTGPFLDAQGGVIANGSQVPVSRWASKDRVPRDLQVTPSDGQALYDPTRASLWLDGVAALAFPTRQLRGEHTGAILWAAHGGWATERTLVRCIGGTGNLQGTITLGAHVGGATTTIGITGTDGSVALLRDTANFRDNHVECDEQYAVVWRREPGVSISLSLWRILALDGSLVEPPLTLSTTATDENPGLSLELQFGALQGHLHHVWIAPNADEIPPNHTPVHAAPYLVFHLSTAEGAPGFITTFDRELGYGDSVAGVIDGIGDSATTNGRKSTVVLRPPNTDRQTQSTMLVTDERGRRVMRRLLADITNTTEPQFRFHNDNDVLPLDRPPRQAMTGRPGRTGGALIVVLRLHGPGQRGHPLHIAGSDVCAGGTGRPRECFGLPTWGGDLPGMDLPYEELFVYAVVARQAEASLGLPAGTRAFVFAGPEGRLVRQTHLVTDPMAPDLGHPFADPWRPGGDVMGIIGPHLAADVAELLLFDHHITDTQLQLTAAALASRWQLQTPTIRRVAITSYKWAQQLAEGQTWAGPLQWNPTDGQSLINGCVPHMTKYNHESWKNGWVQLPTRDQNAIPSEVRPVNIRFSFRAAAACTRISVYCMWGRAETFTQTIENRPVSAVVTTNGINSNVALDWTRMTWCVAGNWDGPDAGVWRVDVNTPNSPLAADTDHIIEFQIPFLEGRWGSDGIWRHATMEALEIGQIVAYQPWSATNDAIAPSVIYNETLTTGLGWYLGVTTNPRTLANTTIFAVYELDDANVLGEQAYLLVSDDYNGAPGFVVGSRPTSPGPTFHAGYQVGTSAVEVTWGGGTLPSGKQNILIVARFRVDDITNQDRVTLSVNGGPIQSSGSAIQGWTDGSIPLEPGVSCLPKILGTDWFVPAGWEVGLRARQFTVYGADMPLAHEKYMTNNILWRWGITPWGG